MTRTVEPRVLKGFRDFLPEEEAQRSFLLRKIAESFELCGFVPLQTPALEYHDILTGKYGEEGEKLLYCFKDHGNRTVALRYDLTVPLARVVAQHRDLPRPFKRYQIGTVWRAEKPAHGRFREFVQCDADIVGSSSPIADAECIAAGMIALEALGVDFEVRIGHRGVLNAVLEAHGISDIGVQLAALRAIDKAEKIGWEGVLRLLSDLVSVEKAEAVIARIRQASEDLAQKERVAAEGVVRHVKSVVEALEVYGFGNRIRVDFSIARGLDYYTGTVFETFLRDLPSVGSVMSGGRYDALTKLFGEEDWPAVGLSIGVDRLLSALRELGLLPNVLTGPLVIVCPVGADSVAFALAVVALLRKASIASEIVPDESWRLKKALQYASRRKARFAAIVGTEEVQAKTVALKDLLLGEQKSVGLGEIVLEIQRAVVQGG